LLEVALVIVRVCRRLALLDQQKLAAQSAAPLAKTATPELAPQFMPTMLAALAALVVAERATARRWQQAAPGWLAAPTLVLAGLAAAAALGRPQA
jgi:hypothetical protein